MSTEVTKKAIKMEILHPMNYDFGSNWNTKIKPFLDHPQIKQALRNGINGYLSLFPTRERYKVNTCPANYSSKDGYAMLMMRKDENLLEELRKANRLPQKYLALERQMDDDGGELFMRMQNKILRPYRQWDQIKYDLESYYLSGACHHYNPTFGLTLARLVEPAEAWRVQVSDKHTTIVNRNNTKIFDLLYWCCDGRLENYMFGDPVDVEDETMGGRKAYLDSIV